MHIDLDRAGDGVRRRRDDVCRPPAAVPEVLRAVLVRDEEDGDRGVGVDGADGCGARGKVLRGAGGESLLQRADQIRVLGFQRVLLRVGGFLRGVNQSVRSLAKAETLPVQCGPIERMSGWLCRSIARRLASCVR